METIVLSGPEDRAAQARTMLKQKGMCVEESVDNVRSATGPIAKREYDYGFERRQGESFITAFGDVNDWQVVEPLGFMLRLHWTNGTEGEWKNDMTQQRDPVRELDELKAALRAAGISIPGSN